MRVTTTLSWGSDITKITSQYRISVASLIKEAFSKSSVAFMDTLYGSGNKFKPFTFAMHFPLDRSRSEKNFIYLSGNTAKLTFSSSDYDYIMHYCNGMQRVKEYNLGFRVRVGQTTLLPNENLAETRRIWHTDAAAFHMIDDEGKRSGYAKHGEYGFNAAVMRHIQAKVSKAFPEIAADELDAITINWIWAKNIVVPHYNSPVHCVEGVFQLDAPPMVQQLFYDTGLGARNAQGFGMLNRGELRMGAV